MEFDLRAIRHLLVATVTLAFELLRGDGAPWTKGVRMKVFRAAVWACVLVVVAGCGGGGGGSSKKPAPAATASVAITTAAISAEAILGDDYRTTINGTWTGSNLGSNQVYLQITDNGGTFLVPASQLATGTGFTYTLPLVDGIVPGARQGTLTVKACKDAQCAQPYTNASASVNYQLQVYEPVVATTITSPAVVETVDLGDDFRTVVTGTWAATHLGTNKVYLQISDDAGTFATPAPQVQSAPGSFNFTLPLIAGLPTTARSGLLTVRACKDSLCTKPYANSTISVGYQLQFMRITEWETHQRNAAHDGYVPITLDPAKFAKAWEWQNPIADWSAPINAVVTNNGAVYLSTKSSTEAAVYSLDEYTGQQLWKVSLGPQPYFNPPAFHDGRIYVATTGHEATYLWSFDASSGEFKFKAPFSTQWPSLLAPTVYGAQVFTNGGYYGGYVYAYDRLDGTALWANGSDGDDDMSTPAVDEDNVYYHSGKSMVIWNRMTGERIAMIADPFATNWGYSYHGSPMLGGRKNVVAFAGSAFSGRGNASAEQYEHRVLSSFNIETRTWEWATRNAYLTHPAVAKGVIYAARNRANYLDAIDESTGEVLWSWSPMPDQGDTEFHRNIVVTRNLLFVSTNAAVYAIDLATHKPVWRYPVPGMLAISSNRTLYIVAGATESTGKLIAIKLK